jgi:flagellar biosynthetic protein FliR
VPETQHPQLRQETGDESGPSSNRHPGIAMQSFFFSPEEVLRFAVVLFRVAGVMAFAPFYSMGAFPKSVKITIPLMVALALTPTVPQELIPAEFGLAEITVALLGEAIIGIVLGLTAAFVFSAIQLAGQIMGFQLGFSIVNIIDPQTAVKTSVISIFQNFVALSFFLLINGHHWFFLAISDSLQYLPVGGIHVNAPLVQELVRLSAQIFVSGLQIAAPVVAVTICSDVVIGIIGRSAPQINILIVGMPVKTLVGLSGLSIAFYFLPNVLGSYFIQLSETLMSIVRSMV